MGQHDEDTGTTSPLLDDDEIGLIDESLRLLSDRADVVVSHFYAMLFAEAPATAAAVPGGDGRPAGPVLPGPGRRRSAASASPSVLLPMLDAARP